MFQDELLHILSNKVHDPLKQDSNRLESRIGLFKGPWAVCDDYKVIHTYLSICPCSNRKSFLCAQDQKFDLGQIKSLSC